MTEAGTVKIVRSVFGESHSSYIGYADWPALSSNIQSSQAERIVVAALMTLSAREATILQYRYGLQGEELHTLKDASQHFRITPERIRQIETKGLRKLRHPSRSRKLKGLLYWPTSTDERVVFARQELHKRLKLIYGRELSKTIAVSIHRRHLRSAFVAIMTTSDKLEIRKKIGKLMADSCTVYEAEYGCLFCGLPIGTQQLRERQFCSQRCKWAYGKIEVICDWCGKLFKRSVSLVIRRLTIEKRAGSFCSATCTGQWLGKTKGKK